MRNLLTDQEVFQAADFLAKVEVVGSNPITRSNFSHQKSHGFALPRVERVGTDSQT